MTTSVVDAESVLAIDVGSIFTRASFFDVVEANYHFVAGGVVPSTAGHPFYDVGEGVYQALERLQQITGRVFLDGEANLAIPTQPDGNGVDRVVLTYSVGTKLKMVVAGLLPDVSLESARRLATSCYGRVVDAIGLTDRRKPEMQVDAILRARPDLIILVGGTDQGASRSVIKLAELVILACRVLPKHQRPQLFYAGNQALSKKIKEVMEKWTTTYVAPNVRPGIDLEDIAPARDILSRAATTIHFDQIDGLQQLASICSTFPIATAHAFGRMVRFLSRVYDPVKGVLGVDLGASATTIAASVSGELALDVLPYGMGKGLAELLKTCPLKEITRWLPMHLPETVVHDYLWQRSLYPAALPLTEETLAIEQAAARQMLYLAIRHSQKNWVLEGMTFEPIVASGTFLCNAPQPWQSLLMLLDGLQPVGITTFIMDQNALAASLGAIARINSVLPVQVLETAAFINLGTVICPLSSARAGAKIMEVRLEYESGGEVRLDIKKGMLIALPLQPRQVARIHLRGSHRIEIDPRSKGGAGIFKIVGGACGAVIDARGRPLVLPKDASKRHELLLKWKKSLSGELVR